MLKAVPCAPQAFPQERLPGMSVHWPGLVGLGGVGSGWRARVATVVSEKGQGQVRKQCCFSSLRHPKGLGSTGTTHAPQILAGGLLSWLLRLLLVGLQGLI